MRRIWLCVGVAVIFGITESVPGSAQIVDFSEVLVHSSFLQMTFRLEHLLDFALRIIKFLVFQSLWGIYIYRHFCAASVYFFSRKANRIQWFLKESMQLYAYAFLYMASIGITATAWTMCRCTVVFSKESFGLLIYYMAYYPLWLFATTLLINILAIWLTSGPAFCIVAGIQLVMITSLNLWDSLLSIETELHAVRNEMLLQWNPAAHLVLGWHDSHAIAVEQAKEIICINIGMNTTVIYFLALSILVLAAGILVVNRKDIIASNIETGGL